MPLRDFLKELGLDPELIERDREMSAGLANAHESHSHNLPDAGQSFVTVMASATEYRRAGAHSVLLSDREGAREMFRRAARMYGSLRKPYAVMMFSCADGDLGSIMASAHDFGFAKDIERTQLPYLLLASAAGRENRDHEAFEKIRSSIEASQNTPVGVLGIPIGSYLDLAGALAQDKPAPRRLAEALLPFLVPFSSAIRRCMEDTYHWERLAFPFHPVEPDILGVLFCVESTLRWTQQGSLLEMIRDFPLGDVSANLFYNAIFERFEDGKPGQRFR